MTGFQHDIAGGQGNLVITSLKSPNFVHGSTGWAINKDGSAEFHSILLPSGAAGATIYFASTAPVGANVGDLWYNTAAGLQLSQWDGASWVPHQIGTGAIANNAITQALLASGAVGTSQIASAAITNALLASAAVGTSNIASGAVTAAQINAAAGILGSQLSSSAGITGSQLSSSAGITSGQVSFTARNIGGITTTVAASAPGSPQAGDLWYDSSNGFKLNQYASGIWTAYQYGTNAIAAGSVTAALIAANTITASQIASGTITATQIASATITASQIAAGTITSGLIAADAITAGLVAAGAVDGLTINGVTINGNTVNAADIIISAGSGNSLTAYGSGVPAYKSAILQSGASLTGTSHAYTVTGSTAAADAILVSVAVNGSSSDLVTGVTDSAGNTYSRIQGEPSSGAGGFIYQYIALNCTALTGGTSTITLSYSSGLTSQQVSTTAINLADVATALAVDKKAVGSGSSPQSLSTGALASSPEIVIGSWVASGTQPNYSLTVTDSVFASAAVAGDTLVCWAPAATTASVTNSLSTSGTTLTGCLVSLKAAGTPVLVGAVAGAAGTDQYSDAFTGGYTGQVTAFQPGSTPTVVETWHSVSLAAGLSGTLRCKRLAESNFMLIDAELTFTYSGSSQTFVCGSLPSSNYYPTVSRQFPIAVTGTPSGVTATWPRLFVGTSGGVQILVPSGSGASPSISFTQMVALD